MYGLDLLDFFRGRYSWRKLANLLSKLRLSDRSLLVQAQESDPERAEWLLTQPERPPGAPPLADWTPDHAQLVAIKDRLGEVVATIAATASGKYKAPPPSRYPVTAADRLRAQRRKARHESLVAEVMEAQERWEAARPSEN